jgi:CBS domain-containing protein
VICPVCGYENIQGVDECENCGADLRTVDIPAPGTAFEAKLVDVPLSEVHPHLPLTIDARASVAEAVTRMRDAAVGCLLVVSGRGLEGILSERDLVMKAVDGAANLDATKVGDLMTPDPVVLRADDSVAVAIHKMAVGGFRHIPLVNDGQPTGIVSARDLFKYILDALA